MQPNKIAIKQILGGGVMALIAAVAANLIILFIVKAVLPLPLEFPPLQPFPIAFFTTIGVVGAVIALAIVSRLAKNPVRVYWIVALVALVLSIIPNVLLMVNPTAMPGPEATPLAAAVLIIFHVVAAAICIGLFTRMLESTSSQSA